jgi:hypothetical protein
MRSRLPTRLSLLVFSPVLLAAAACAGASWVDLAPASGLALDAPAALKFTDLNGDGWPDVVIIPDSPEPVSPRVFLHPGPAYGEGGPRYLEHLDHGLPLVARGDVLVFADLDNDGHGDALHACYLDPYQDDYQPRAHPPGRTAWYPGNGDGSFGGARVIEAATLGTTRAVAVGDVNEDGLPDLFLGNWYERYFSGYEAFANDLLLQYPAQEDRPDFARWPMPGETAVTSHELDGGGRPTYGVAFARLDPGLPYLIELNYGRRWNRLYAMRVRPPLYLPPGSEGPPPPLVLRDPRAHGAHLVRQLQGSDLAPSAGVDGDHIRHGRHPRWPEELARARPRSHRPDEPPFRANGNTFDVALGDIDNDGDFDLFLTTIIHAWAGESSDRSRFLLNQLKETGRLEFVSFERLSVDRIPESPPPGEPLEAVHTQYNQGDIFAALADLNHDGRLDLILCSSDYPDPPPHDERLRLYFQQEDGRFRDVTAELGIDHVGAGMPSLADVDGDGALDLLIGQSFHRLNAQQRRAAALASGALAPDAPEDARPLTRVRLFRNTSAEGRASLLLRLTGDPSAGVTRDAYGAIVRVIADLDGDEATAPVAQIRQVMGPHGHAGKQSDLTLHFGLGEADRARVEVHWPGPGRHVTIFEDLAAGRYHLEQGAAAPRPLP